MTRHDAIAALKVQAEAVKALGATALYLFGSTARDEAAARSDLDLFIDYDRDTRFSLVELVSASTCFLERRLGVPVDRPPGSSLDPSAAGPDRGFGSARFSRPELSALLVANLDAITRFETRAGEPLDDPSTWPDRPLRHCVQRCVESRRRLARRGVRSQLKRAVGFRNQEADRTTPPTPPPRESRPVQLLRPRQIELALQVEPERGAGSEGAAEASAVSGEIPRLPLRISVRRLAGTRSLAPARWPSGRARPAPPGTPRPDGPAQKRSRRGRGKDVVFNRHWSCL